VSPSTARWQQQINSSFEALVNDALLSPHSEANISHHGTADCTDWRYATEDLRSGLCPTTVDELHRLPDWSLRHLEQRSDSRDSGLESDAATDRHCPASKKIRNSIADSLHSAFAEQQQNITNSARSSSSFPTQLQMFTEADNCQLLSALGRRKRHVAALSMLHHSNADELTNGYTPQYTSDVNGSAFLQHRASLFALNDVSGPLCSKSECFST